MTIYNFEKSDFVGMVPANGSADLIPRSLATTLWTEMQNHGFKLVATDNAGNTLTGATKAVIFEPKPEVDPLVSTSPWRIYMEVFGTANIPGTKTDATTGAVTPVAVPVANTGLRFAVATPDQIPDDITKKSAALQMYPIIPAQIFNPPTTYAFPGQAYTPRAWDSATMSLSFTSAQRGLVIAAWMNDILDNMEYMGVVCIQRGVSCGGSIDTGATGQKPLFMVTNVTPVAVGTGGTDDKSAAGPHSNWYYQVIREVDTIVSSPNWGTASAQVNDGSYNYLPTTIGDDLERRGNMLYRFPTKWLAPVISDTNQYHLIFPFGLCTSRFAYSEELDLLAVSKADAYRTGQQIPINVYGESGDRLYTAITSNSKNNANAGGIRVFVLASGPGN
jgi:hypothetical protein